MLNDSHIFKGVPVRFTGYTDAQLHYFMSTYFAHTTVNGVYQVPKTFMLFGREWAACIGLSSGVAQGYSQVWAVELCYDVVPVRQAKTLLYAGRPFISKGRIGVFGAGPLVLCRGSNLGLSHLSGIPA